MMLMLSVVFVMVGYDYIVWFWEVMCGVCY